MTNSVRSRSSQIDVGRREEVGVALHGQKADRLSERPKPMRSCGQKGPGRRKDRDALAPSPAPSSGVALVPPLLLNLLFSSPIYVDFRH